MFNTDFLFHPGKMTIVMDGGAGSSGKGKLGAFIGKHADNYQFCCNAFMSNAAHWVESDDGKRYLYQSLNSIAHMPDKYQKMFICGGAVVELEPLLKEISQHGLAPDKLGIHPVCAIVQKKDIDYERGTCNFEGDYFDDAVQSDCMKLGSTLHGVGAARARRILRRSDVKIARDIPELKKFICYTDKEMMDRLDDGQSGLMEIAQGYQLGYLSRWYPKCTSRNCTVAAGLDDCGLPPSTAGDVILNFRTFPIRVNNNKYVHVDGGDILTAEDMDAMRKNGQGDKIKVLKGDSGGCYEDQKEITWEDVTNTSGIKSIDPCAEIRERTSLTKLERRVYTFSKTNLREAIRFNRSNGLTYISINFINYIDINMRGVRGEYNKLTDKAVDWLSGNVGPLDTTKEILKFVGTGPKTDDMIMI